jgi:predicted nucleic acid-binding protein
LDTNVVSELIRPRPDRNVVTWIKSVDEACLFLSVLTLGEIRSGILRLTAGARRIRLENWLETELRQRFQGRILPVDHGIATRWGFLAAQAAAVGRPVPVVDALLAATALEHDLTFVTRNIADVSITGVQTLNPWA